MANTEIFLPSCGGKTAIYFIIAIFISPSGEIIALFSFCIFCLRKKFFSWVHSSFFYKVTKIFTGKAWLFYVCISHK